MRCTLLWLYLCVVDVSGVDLHHVADVCNNDGITTPSPICMATPDDTSVDASVRPPSSQYSPTGWDVRTRCCYGTYTTFCSSEYNTGTSTCYPDGQTWAEAKATCESENRRLCTVAELSTCCLSGCMGDVRTVWTSDVCGTYSYSAPWPSLDNAATEAGLACSLSGPHVDKYVQIVGNRCVNANSFVDDVNTFTTQSAAIDALKAIHDAAGGAQSSSCQSIVYLPAWDFQPFQRFVLVKGTNLLTL